jgi:hypothetical protein
VESKEVHVKAHVRVIKQRAYRFVCKQCNEVVERICYPSLPQYCERCRPPKSTSKQPDAPKLVKSKKKLPITKSNDLGVAVGE